jgi:hypothetical protein
MLNKHYCASLNKYFFKKIFITSSIKLNLFFLKKERVLVLSNSSSSNYFILPDILDVIYKNNYIYFIILKAKKVPFKILYVFFSNFRVFLRELLKVSSITIFIRGVGLKINFSELSNFILALKLGFSHLIYFPILKSIASISLFKKKMILCSYNKIVLGNVSNMLCKYKPLNIFTGKGLLIKQKKKFKLKEYVKKI